MLEINVSLLLGRFVAFGITDIMFAVHRESLSFEFLEELNVIKRGSINISRTSFFNGTIKLAHSESTCSIIVIYVKTNHNYKKNIPGLHRLKSTRPIENPRLTPQIILAHTNLLNGGRPV